MQQADIFDLFFETSRFAAAGKSCKTSAAGAQRPTRDCYLEIDELL